MQNPPLAFTGMKTRTPPPWACFVLVVALAPAFRGCVISSLSRAVQWGAMADTRGRRCCPRSLL